MQRWTSILHQTISTTRGVRDQPGVIDVWIKLQVSRKPCFHTGLNVNNESTTNETQQHWPHSDRPAVSLALIHAYAFIHSCFNICCQIRSNLMYLQGTIFRAHNHTKQAKNRQISDRSVCGECVCIRVNHKLALYLKPKTALISQHLTSARFHISTWPNLIWKHWKSTFDNTVKKSH